MTIQEARDILKEEVYGLSDEAVEKIIVDASPLCDAIITVFEDYLTHFKKDEHNGGRL